MIEKRLFGRTGHWSTATLFGGAALYKASEAEADRTLEILLQYGINHIDTANSYGDAEKRIGPWMDHHRDAFFLATKTEERAYRGAMEHLHRSLDLLHTDQLDLWQMHVLVEPDEWEVAMGPDGALEAFVEAKEEGLVRFLGVTGHGVQAPRMHLRSLERYDFDAVLLPYNYVMMQNPQYAADFEKLMSVCKERNVAVQTIKSISRGPWDDNPQTRNTWYEPLEDQAEIDRAVHWALSRPGVFLNTAADIELLPRVLDAASRFESRPSEEAMAHQVEALEITPLFV
ncbi:MAG: Protein tas [Anaerolineales bacterium]|nr:Protein tas [Anaerolineales bacterium]